VGEVDDEFVEEEEEEVVAPPKRSRRTVVKAAPADFEPEEDEEEEDEEVVVPAKKTAPAKKAVVVESEEEDDEDDEESFEVQGFEGFEVGKTYQLTPIGDGTYIVTVFEGTAPVVPGKRRGMGMSGKAFEQEVMTAEYLAWREEWQSMNAVEKEKTVKKAKVRWDEHDNPNINTMRMGQAYVEHLGLSKYKPEYSTNAARAAVRGK